MLDDVLLLDVVKNNLIDMISFDISTCLKAITNINLFCLALLIVLKQYSHKILELVNWILTIKQLEVFSPNHIFLVHRSNNTAQINSLQLFLPQQLLQHRDLVYLECTRDIDFDGDIYLIEYVVDNEESFGYFLFV